MREKYFFSVFPVAADRVVPYDPSQEGTPHPYGRVPSERAEVSDAETSSSELGEPPRLVPDSDDSDVEPESPPRSWRTSREAMEQLCMAGLVMLTPRRREEVRQEMENEPKRVSFADPVVHLFVEPAEEESPGPAPASVLGVPLERAFQHRAGVPAGDLPPPEARRLSLIHS